MAHRKKTPEVTNEQQKISLLLELMEKLAEQNKRIKELQRTQTIEIQKLETNLQKLKSELQNFRMGKEQPNRSKLQLHRQMKHRVNSIRRILRFAKNHANKMQHKMQLTINQNRKYIVRMFVYLTMATLLIDLGWDSIKAVLKKTFSDKIDVVVDQIRIATNPLLDSLYRGYMEFMSPILSVFLTPVGKLCLLLGFIIYLIIDHAVSIARSRRG